MLRFGDHRIVDHFGHRAGLVARRIDNGAVENKRRIVGEVAWRSEALMPGDGDGEVVDRLRRLFRRLPVEGVLEGEETDIKMFEG